MRFTNKIIYLDSVDSTNNYAANLLKADNVAHGTAIMAENQFGGKGQRGNTWQSEKGKNVTVSVVTMPKNIKIEDQFMLSKLTAISILQLLATVNICAKIKWPNDIYVNGKKIAGILIETGLKNDKIEHAILGIGLNVNQTENLVNNATSIAEILQKKNDVTEILLQLMAFLEQNLKQLELDNSVYLHELYYKNLLNLNEEKKYEIDGKIVLGEIKNITQNGHLEIEIENALLTFDIKEITFLQFE
jgi:BirA family transcriptional regulator, biotin operon repressor / biotin---[acetyl-CoA-carboxylase] ligase